METVGLVLAMLQSTGQLSKVLRRHSLPNSTLQIRAASIEAKIARVESIVTKITARHESERLAIEILAHSLEDLNKIERKISSIIAQLQRFRLARIFSQPPVLSCELDEINSLLTNMEHVFRTTAVSYVQRSEQWQLALAWTLACLCSPANEEQHRLMFKDLQRRLSELVSHVPSPRNANVDAEFNFTMGLVHFESSIGGLVVHHNNRQKIEAAARFFRKACDLGRQEAFRYLGDIYYEGMDIHRCYRTAVSIFKQGAERNDAASMFQLASCYEFGHGVQPCAVTSINFYSKAASNGSGEGMYAMGHFKLHGKFMPCNHGEAVRLLRKALSLKVYAAKDSLALCYEKGVAVDRNSEKAFLLLRESFDEGNLYTTADLAFCYDTGTGVEKNSQAATEVYKQCKARGTWHWDFYKGFYGLRMVKGLGMPKDEAQGKAIIIDATKSGNGIAWFALGECYRFGYGVEKDKRRAKYYYKKAISCENGIQGIVGAYEALGQVFEENDRALMSTNKAMKYYLCGADRLSQISQWKVANAFEIGVGQKKDVHRAVYYFRLCANSGHQLAQKKTISYYMKGHGLERSRVHAKKMMEDAAEKGNREAKH